MRVKYHSAFIIKCLGLSTMEFKLSIQFKYKLQWKGQEIYQATYHNILCSLAPFYA